MKKVILVNQTIRLIGIFILVNRNRMKWNAKVDERTKQKIELLYKEFDKFIQENHAASTSEDAAVLKQWNSFKQIIQKNPTDFQNMHQYINKIGEEESKEQRLVKQTSTSKNHSNSPYSPRANTENAVDINKVKLKRMSAQILGTVNKNNKELFR